jgi:hypothetical protein
MWLNPKAYAIYDKFKNNLEDKPGISPTGELEEPKTVEKFTNISSNNTLFLGISILLNIILILYLLFKNKK